ncbi:hypothetical protein Z043_124062, partial [Scleropages formosus]
GRIPDPAQLKLRDQSCCFWCRTDVPNAAERDWEWHVAHKEMEKDVSSAHRTGCATAVVSSSVPESIKLLPAKHLLFRSVQEPLRSAPVVFATEQQTLVSEELYDSGSAEVVPVITCFSISVLTGRYVGFAVVALLVEINSIFLHLRQVLRMAGLAKSTMYRLNSMVNLGTYVVFRISTLAWMTRWLVLNRDHIPLISYTVGSVGMAIMTAMNIVLFYRLLRSDFLKSSREGWKEKDT